MSVITHILSSYALWFILTQARVPIGWIRDPLTRRYEGFAAFILCPMCSGFWCSLLLALLTVPFTGPANYAAHVGIKALVGTSGIFLVDIVAARIERR